MKGTEILIETDAQRIDEGTAGFGNKGMSLYYPHKQL